MSDANTQKTSMIKRWANTAISVSAILAVLAQLGFPQLFESIKEQRLIEEQVHEEMLELPGKMNERYTKDSALVYEEIIKIKSKYHRLAGKHDRLDDAFKLIHEENIQLRRELDYLKEVAGHNSVAILEEMDKKKDCSYIFYQTNSGDPWGIFDGKYGCVELSELEKKTGCRAFRLPIGESRKVRVR